MMLYMILLSVLSTLVSAHSWASCTNYNTQDTNHLTFGDYNHSKCLGYPRAYRSQYLTEMSQPWGIDTGYDWEHPKCRTSFNNNDYSDITPMAIYNAGQVVHISHPAKQHVADTCTNPFIPSQSMKLLMSSTPTVDTFDINVQMIGEDHKNGVIDHLGYQRCYNFCGDVDNAHCITSWRIPNVNNSGRYSFIWLWEFNPNQFYSTCFDAIVLIPNNTTAPSDSPVPTPASSTPNTETPVPYTEAPTTQTATPAPTPSTTKFPITSDATQLKSIIHELISSIRIAFNGTLTFSMFPET